MPPTRIRPVVLSAVLAALLVGLWGTLYFARPRAPLDKNHRRFVIPHHFYGCSGDEAVFVKTGAPCPTGLQIDPTICARSSIFKERFLARDAAPPTSSVPSSAASPTSSVTLLVVTGLAPSCTETVASCSTTNTFSWINGAESFTSGTSATVSTTLTPPSTSSSVLTDTPTTSTTQPSSSTLTSASSTVSDAVASSTSTTGPSILPISTPSSLTSAGPTTATPSSSSLSTTSQTAPAPLTSATAEASWTKTITIVQGLITVVVVDLMTIASDGQTLVKTQLSATTLQANATASISSSSPASTAASFTPSPASNISSGSATIQSLTSTTTSTVHVSAGSSNHTASSTTGTLDTGSAIQISRTGQSHTSLTVAANLSSPDSPPSASMVTSSAPNAGSWSPLGSTISKLVTATMSDRPSGEVVVAVSYDVVSSINATFTETFKLSVVPITTIPWSGNSAAPSAMPNNTTVAPAWTNSTAQSTVPICGILAVSASPLVLTVPTHGGATLVSHAAPAEHVSDIVDDNGTAFQSTSKGSAGIPTPSLIMKGPPVRQASRYTSATFETSTSLSGQTSFKKTKHTSAKKHTEVSTYNTSIWCNSAAGKVDDKCYDRKTSYDVATKVFKRLDVSDADESLTEATNYLESPVQRNYGIQRRRVHHFFKERKPPGSKGPSNTILTIMKSTTITSTTRVTPFSHFGNGTNAKQSPTIHPIIARHLANNPNSPTIHHPDRTSRGRPDHKLAAKAPWSTYTGPLTSIPLCAQDPCPTLASPYTQPGASTSFETIYGHTPAPTIVYPSSVKSAAKKVYNSVQWCFPCFGCMTGEMLTGLIMATVMTVLMFWEWQEMY